MAFSTPARPIKRRPATYGKSSARKSFGFDTPEEDELAGMIAQPTVDEPEVQDRRKVDQLPSLRTPTYFNRSAVSFSHPSPKRSPVRASATDLDQYDVPSSEGEGSLTATPQHTAKKRKLPQKAPARLNPSPASHHQQEGPSLPRSKVVDSKKKSFSIRNKRLGETSEQSSNLSSRSNSSARAPRLSSNFQISTLATAKPSLSPAFVPRQPSSHDETGSMSSRKSSPSRARSVSPVKGKAFTGSSTPNRRSRAQADFLQASVGPGPVTPPRSDTISYGETPPSRLTSSRRTAETLMSPSNLEMPGLSIDASASSRTPKALPKDTNLLATTPGRSKLKDRLTARDGRGRSAERSVDANCEKDEADMDYAVRDLHPRMHHSSNETPEMSSQDRPPNHVPPISLISSPHQTYSAKRRTFRRDDNEDDLLTSFGMEADEDVGHSTRRIRLEPVALPSNAETDEFDMSEAEEGATSKLKNIHELREAGANFKLSGETEAVLEEIESSNKSTARWGLVNLTQKLEKKSFRISLVSAGLENRVFSQARANLDILSRALLAMSITQLLDESIPRQALEYNMQDVIVLCKTLLGDDATLSAVARSRTLNVNKSIQQDLLRLSKTYSKSPTWSQGEPPRLTVQLLSIQLLEKLTRKLRSTAFKGQILETSTTEEIMNILTSCTPALTQQNVGRDEDDLCLRLILSLLESSSIMYASSDKKNYIGLGSNHLSDLAAMLASIPRWSTAHRNGTLSLLLRLCLNLTNGNADASDPFSQAEVIGAIALFIRSSFDELGGSAEDGDLASQVDNLILALGFLINLAEISERSQSGFLKPAENGRTSLEILLELFASRWLQAFEATSEHELRTNVPMGYLAVLLTFLCAHHGIRRTVALQLEGGSLRHLLVAAEEFLIYNKKVTEDVQTTEDGSDLKAHFLDRLEGLINELKGELPSAQ